MEYPPLSAVLDPEIPRQLRALAADSDAIALRPASACETLLQRPGLWVGFTGFRLRGRLLRCARS